MNWKLAFRHLRRQWRLNLVLWTIMLLGAALLAILPMLAISIAGESLTETLNTSPTTERNILIKGKTVRDEAPEVVRASLGSLFKETMTVRNGNMVATPFIYKLNADPLNLNPQTMVFSIYSFDRLEERVTIIQGKLPQTDVVQDADDNDILEAVIGIEAADRMGLEPGDELSPALGEYRFRIVGIVEPNNPESEIWWDDQQMIPFSAWRRIYTSPDIDEWNLSLIVPSQTIVSRFSHFQVWRVLLNSNQITVLSAPAVLEIISGLQSRLSQQGLILETPLIDLITNFQEKLALAQVTLLLLTTQSLIAVLYVLTMFGRFLVQQSLPELTTLLGRGFSRSSITGLFARSLSLLTIAAGLLAPFLARRLLEIWSNWQRIPIPAFIPPESWYLALAAVLFSWTFLIIAIYRSTHRSQLSGQGRGTADRQQGKQSRQMAWDIFLLTLGGLAYWQFTEGSSLIREGSSTGIADPVLLLGPFILLLAFTLILIRILPVLWQFFARISHYSKGLIWAWGFSRSARQPAGPAQITLLISLTAGLALFVSSFNYSIETWQETIAHYVAGADVRLQNNNPEGSGTIKLDQQTGITARTDVFRSEALIKVDEYQRLEFDFFAIDPETFPLVAAYPAGISQFSIAQVMTALRPLDSGGTPVIISNTANTRHLGAGDNIYLELGENTYALQVSGIIRNFPSTNKPFIVVDIAHLRELLGEDNPLQTRHEIWLETKPEAIAPLIQNLTAEENEFEVLNSVPAEVSRYQNDLVYLEVNTAFEINVLTLMILSATGFFLIQYFSTQTRAAEFSILRAIGLSNQQIRWLLVVEGILYIAIGLIIGLGIGVGLSYLIKPFIAQILPPLQNGLVLNQIQFNWPQIGLQFAFLVGFYSLGLLILMAYSTRKFKAIQTG